MKEEKTWKGYFKWMYSSAFEVVIEAILIGVFCVAGVLIITLPFILLNGGLLGALCSVILSFFIISLALYWNSL